MVARFDFVADASECQVQLWYVDGPVAVKVECFHQRCHFPRWQIHNVGLLKSRLEFIGVNFARTVQINARKEIKRCLSVSLQVVGQHNQFLWCVVMPVIMVVMMQVMMRMVHFVNHSPTCHEQHTLGHGVVEEVEECSAKGDDHYSVVHVIVRVLGTVC